MKLCFMHNWLWCDLMLFYDMMWYDMIWYDIYIFSKVLLKLYLIVFMSKKSRLLQSAQCDKLAYIYYFYLKQNIVLLMSIEFKRKFKMCRLL